MNLSDLLSKGLIEKFQSDKDQIQNEIKNAQKKLESSEKMLEINEWGWAHFAAYNAMLHAGRALMFSKEHRPRSSDHHVAVVSFSTIYEQKYTTEVITAFNQGRKRRSEFQYDDADAISETQGKNMIEKAIKFIDATKNIMKIP